MLYRTTMSPLFNLRRDIDRLWEDALGSASNGSAWMPPVDIRETDSDLRIEFELPGLTPEEVAITAENGTLTVRGEKRGERQEGKEGSRYHLVERTYGAFSRSFQLPAGIDEEKIDAEFEHGVLRVRIPKAALPQPKKIRISAGARSEVKGQTGGQQERVGSGQERGTQDRGNQERGTRNREMAGANS